MRLRHALITLSLVLLTACSTSTSSVIPIEQREMPGAENAYRRAGDTRIDLSRSTLTATARVGGVNVTGTFSDFFLHLDLEKSSLASGVTVQSLQLSDASLQSAALGPAVLDAALFPSATFVATSIDALGGNQYQITGDLTLRGITRSLTVATTITNDGMTFQFPVTLSDFGITAETLQGSAMSPVLQVTGRFVFAN